MSQIPKKQPNLNKTGWLNTAVLGVIVFLIGVGGIFYMFVEGQTRYLTERNFRLLALHSSLLTQTLASFEKVAQNSIRAAQDSIESSTLTQKMSVQCPYNEQTLIGHSEQTKKIVWEILEKICQAPFFQPITIDLKLEDNKAKVPLSNNTFSVQLENHEASSRFRLTYALPSPKAVEVQAVIPLDKMMQRLELGVEKFVFDDILLADETGKIFYQENPSVFQYDSVVCLLLGREPESILPNDKEIKASGCPQDGSKTPSLNDARMQLIDTLPLSRDIVIGELPYKIFAQAVTLPRTQSDIAVPATTSNSQETSSASSPKMEQKPIATKAILIGLIQTGKFRNQVNAIAPTHLVFLLFVGMGLVFGLPFLKLWTMGPQDRLNIVDVLSLFFSCLVGTALLVIFFLYGYVSWTEEDRLTNQLQTMAEDINETFNAELRNILNQLNALPTTESFAEALDKIKEDIKKPTPRIEILRTEGESVDSKDKTIGIYPFFGQLSWIAKDGWQKIKWSTTDKTTSFVPVFSRPYFQHVYNANQQKDPELFLMKYAKWLPHGPPVSYNLLSPQTMNNVIWMPPTPSKYYWLQPIFSMTKGTFTPVVSIPFESQEQKETNNPNLEVVSMTPNLISLRQITLPPGFGFAVVTRGLTQDFPEGQVLFHSDHKRNLRENFLEETDEDSELRSLIRFGNTGAVKSRYWGESHTFYVHPLESTPWTLVVFANNGILWTPILQALILSVVLFGIYAFFVIVVFFLGILVFRTIRLGKGIWLWPQPSLAPSYRSALGWNLLFMLVFGGILWKANSNGAWSNSLLTASVILPIAGIVTLLFVGQNRGSNFDGSTGNSKYLDPKESDKCDYLHLMMSLLILLSILPALGFFKLSFDVGSTLFRGDIQKAYQERIIGRAQATIETYRTKVPGIVETSAMGDNEKFIQNIFDKSLINIPNRETAKSLWSCAYLTQLPGLENFPRWYAWLRTKFSLYSLTEQTSTGPKSPESIEEIKSLCPHEDREPWRTNGFIKNPHRLPGWLFGISVGGLLIFVCVRWFRFSPERSLRKRILTFIQACTPWIIGLSGMLALVMIIFWPKELERLLIYPSFLTLLLFTLFVVLFLLPRFIVRRIFLFDVVKPIRWEENNLHHLLNNTAQLDFPGVLITGPPGSGKSKSFEKASTQVVHRINLRELREDSRARFLTILQEAVGQPEDKVILMDHFEYARGTRAYDEQKLELLEELLKQKKHVCVISDIHPLDQEFFLGPEDDGSPEETNNSPQFLNRWMEVFHMFVTVPFAATTRKDTPNMEFDTRTHLNKFRNLLTRTKSEKDNVDPTTDLSEWRIEGVRSLARSYYQSLWASCTNDEKLTLYHLAADRFLHSENPNFRALYEKGLIEIRPDLRFMYESFRQFVLAIGDKENIVALEKSGPESLWNIVHRPLVVALIIVGVFLVTTQESIKSDFLAFIGIIPVALPALAKFFSIFRQNRSPS